MSDPLISWTLLKTLAENFIEESDDDDITIDGFLEYVYDAVTENDEVEEY